MDKTGDMERGGGGGGNSCRPYRSQNKSPFWRPKRELEDNIKIYVMEVGLGIAQRRAERPGFDSRQCKIFLFFTASRPTLGPTKLPIPWVPGTLSPGVRRQGREADHSLPSCTEVTEGGAISPLPPYVIMV
jgi:hypothetical protein